MDAAEWLTANGHTMNWKTADGLTAYGYAKN